VARHELDGAGRPVRELDGGYRGTGPVVAEYKTPPTELPAATWDEAAGYWRSPVMGAAEMGVAEMATRENKHEMGG
jgi:hypothetical protein